MGFSAVLLQSGQEKSVKKRRKNNRIPLNGDTLDCRFLKNA
jgi:hypothetical protein